MPIIPTIIGAARRVSSQERYWCWISEGHVYFGVGLFDVPVAIILLTNIVLYALTWRHIHHVASTVNEQVSSPRRQSYLTKVTSFILIFVLCWVWIVLDDVTDIVSPAHSNYVLAVSAFLSPLNGTLNAILYGWGMNKTLMRKLKCCGADSSDGTAVMNSSTISMDAVGDPGKEVI